MAGSGLVLDEKGQVLTDSGQELPDSSVLALELHTSQMKFAEGYLKHWDKERAIKETDLNLDNIQVKYNTICNFWNDPDVRAYISARTREMGMEADEWIARTAQIATASIEDFISVNETGVYVDLMKAKERGKLHLLEYVKYDAKGQLEFRLLDRMEAHRMLGRALGVLDGPEIQVDNYVITIKRDGE